jgi:hypothetical protein
MPLDFHLTMRNAVEKKTEWQKMRRKEFLAWLDKEV